MNPENLSIKDPGDNSGYWILQIPGTTETVVVLRQDEACGPLTFATEEDALAFHEQNDLHPRYQPVYIEPDTAH